MGMHDRSVGLLGKLVSRVQPRLAEQRCEPRCDDLVERAIILFRGQDYVVRVVNISPRGTMIESDIAARIGEALLVQFENCCRIHGFVRWVRDGKVGVGFGHEIVLERVGRK